MHRAQCPSPAVASSPVNVGQEAAACLLSESRIGNTAAVQATEEELFSLFAPIGEILELYILRNSNGKSRGCAFVTYANKFLAQQAITQLNGKQVHCAAPLTFAHLLSGLRVAVNEHCMTGLPGG
jgi:hypothetical protein